MSAAPNTTAPTFASMHHPEQQAQVQVPQLVAPEAGQPTGQLSGASALLAKKVSNGQNFYSPTDGMVSPCTSKLVDAKKRHFVKGKPMSLSSTFAQSQPKQSGLSHVSTQQENQSPQSTQ